jgi:hypothetical protein
MAYHKVRFVGRAGATAGLVVNTADHDVRNVSAISRLYPVSEAGKMRRFQVSPAFETAREAFDFTFEPVMVDGRYRHGA